MNHLSDEILNEYLDDALSPDARAEVESHLRGCADCELRLDQLADLFFVLSALPEADLTRDLSADVVRTLTPQPLPRLLKWTALLQMAAALTALVASLPLLQTMFAMDIPAITLPTLLDLTLRFEQAVVEMQTLFMPYQWQMPRLSFEVSSLSITVAVFSVTLLWLVGNGLLLRKSNLIRS
jgi:anti-sigma factor RsiW